MSWLTININPPKLDCHIVARTADEFGYGYNVSAFEFDSSIFTEEEVAMHLESHNFVEWMELLE